MREKETETEKYQKEIKLMYVIRDLIIKKREREREKFHHG